MLALQAIGKSDAIIANDKFLKRDTGISTHLGFFAFDRARCIGHVGIFDTNPFTKQLHAAAGSGGFDNRRFKTACLTEFFCRDR